MSDLRELAAISPQAGIGGPVALLQREVRGLEAPSRAERKSAKIANGNATGISHLQVRDVLLTVSASRPREFSARYCANAQNFAHFLCRTLGRNSVLGASNRVRTNAQ